MTVPVARQCTLPRCENEAVNPSRPGSLCEFHLDAVESGEPVTEPDESGVSSTHLENSPNGDTSSESKVSAIPSPLDELGAVFIPIGPGEKGARRPRTPENLFEATDPVLEAYLEAGHNYGVTCRDGLAVLDADDPEGLADVIDALPATAWQVSGSGEGEHYFLHVPGLDEDMKLFHPDTDGHLGEIKAAAQSYVVGPGSRHPSGGRYGPLQGDTLATVDEEDLRDLLEPYLRPSARDRTAFDPDDVDTHTEGTRLSVHDVVSRRAYPTGARREHPFHASDTGANFMVDDRGDTFRCWRHGCTGNALHLVGVEQGIISCGDWVPGGLSTDTWREIFEKAREAGYDLPEYTPSDDVESVAVLPNSPRTRATTNGWDWTQAGRAANASLSIDDARARCQDAIEDALEGSDQVLIEALPTLGKSYGTIAAAAKTGVPVTILTGRGRKEQYEQIREWCDEFGLTHKTLPAFTRDCETANGEHGEEWRQRVMDWYRRGATPQAIHREAEYELGRPLPCQEHGECGLTSKWRFDPKRHPDTGEPYDVLIGHYAHAHKRKVTKGRTVVFDEFPAGAYETTLDGMLPGAVTYFLKSTDAVPFESFTDLIENRNDHERRADALLWFDSQDLERDESQVFANGAGHALAPLAVYTILAGPGNDLGNGWERSHISGRMVGLYDRENVRVHVLSPPPLTLDRKAYTRGVIALDGTPTKRMWELSLGIRLHHRQILTDGERREYVSDALNLALVRTTDAVKPYNSADHVATTQDAALFEAINEEHGSKPALITTATAEKEYDVAGIDDLVSATQHYGNVLGSNQFKSTRLGCVVGSNHYGDQYIQKWGAFAGERVESPDRSDPENRGSALSYGAFGDRILTHMRENETLQAAMRFGRDGNGAVVYVHTNTLPDWVPLAGEGRVVTAYSRGMKQVVRALGELESARTVDVVNHPDVEIGERQALNVLTDLVERDLVTADTDDDDGRAFVWVDDGLHRLNEYGEAELETVDVDTLSDSEVHEISRSSYYTWNFVNLHPPDGATLGEESRSDDVGSNLSTSGGDPPPNEAD